MNGQKKLTLQCRCTNAAKRLNQKGYFALSRGNLDKATREV